MNALNSPTCLNTIRETFSNTYSGRYISGKFILSCVLFPCLILARLDAALDPADWPAEIRAQIESKELRPLPSEARQTRVSGGMISASASPIAMEAGLRALKEGGSAADAAITVALTQIATTAGSVVSYAGVVEVVYYDASTETVQTLSAPWKTYKGEKEVQPIPSTTELEGGQGRKTLVPGFMAGMEALHKRHGRLEWSELFAPSIHYAENGIEVGRVLNSWIKGRAKVLGRTDSGKAFLQGGGEAFPQVGDRFFQRETAATLRAIASEGASYIYSGKWAEAYVDAIQNEGGNVTIDDLKEYAPEWRDPLTATFGKSKIYAARTKGSASVLLSLNMALASGLMDLPPYWESPEAFSRLAKTSYLAEIMFNLDPEGWSMEQCAKLSYAQEKLKANFPELIQAKDNISEHSAAIVVVDEEGNIAALTHSINTSIWGSTGIVVEGIPIADAASINYYHWSKQKPGDYVLTSIPPVIVFEDDEPVFAVSTIGRGLIRETSRVLLRFVGGDFDIASIVNTPQWLVRNYPSGATKIVEGTYSEEFLEELSELGALYEEVPKSKRFSNVGWASFIQLDPTSGEFIGQEDPRFMNFVEGYNRP